MFNAHTDVRKQMPHLTTLPFQLLHHEVTVLFSNEKEGKEGMEGSGRKGAGEHQVAHLCPHSAVQAML